MGEVTLIVFTGDFMQTLLQWYLKVGNTIKVEYKKIEKLEACKNTSTGYINTQVLVR